MKQRTNNPLHILIISAILMGLIALTSCSQYTGERATSGCGVWHPKIFTGEGHPRHERSHRPIFGR